MLGGRIAKLLLGISLLALAGCGGGGGGGGSSDEPPAPPWTLNIYDSPNGESLAQGTLTNQGGQYLVALEGKEYSLSQKDVSFSSGRVTLPLADQKEAFSAAEFQKEMASLAKGQEAALHSIATDKIYIFTPVLAVEK